ncbi:MAG TPA: hypothetical protein VHF06_37850, partial [Pseudonocardiaceae bacterium]|nr:hypothetical protein [Pseudonocardiaceae bacterium]
IVSQEIAFFSGPGVQIGGSSLLAGGGSIVLGIANASTVPSTNPTGGGVLYCEGGALKFRGSSGDIFNTAKQTVTGSRGGNAALASLLTALANAGLITDSTS